METAAVPHDRDRLNDEIERARINTSWAVTQIRLYQQTSRSVPVLDLFEKFYQSFYYLVDLTEDLEQMDDPDVEAKARGWLNSKIPNMTDDKLILKFCDEGISIYLKYKKSLSQKGVISLPGG